MSTVNVGMLKMDITEMAVNNNGNTIAESDRKIQSRDFYIQKAWRNNRNSSRWQWICFFYIFVRKEDQSSQTNFKSEKV